MSTSKPPAGPLEAVSGGTQEGLEASAAPPHEHTGYVLGCLVCHDLVIEKYTALRGLVTGNATPKEAPPSPDSPSQGERKQQLQDQDRAPSARSLPASAEETRARALCDALCVVQHARDHYDEGIFSPEGTSQECRSAKCARGLLDGIMEDMCALFRTGNAGVSPPPSPSSASLESGGGTLDTMGAATRKPSSGEER